MLDAPRCWKVCCTEYLLRKPEPSKSRIDWKTGKEGTLHLHLSDFKACAPFLFPVK